MKKYVEPAIKVHKIQSMAILAGSEQGVTVKGLTTVNGGNSIFTDDSDDQSSSGWTETSNE